MLAGITTVGETKTWTLQDVMDSNDALDVKDALEQEQQERNKPRR